MALNWQGALEGLAVGSTQLANDRIRQYDIEAEAARQRSFLQMQSNLQQRQAKDLARLQYGYGLQRDKENYARNLHLAMVEDHFSRNRQTDDLEAQQAWALDPRRIEHARRIAAAEAGEQFAAAERLAELEETKKQQLLARGRELLGANSQQFKAYQQQLELGIKPTEGSTIKWTADAIARVNNDVANRVEDSTAGWSAQDYQVAGSRYGLNPGEARSESIFRAQVKDALRRESVSEILSTGTGGALMAAQPGRPSRRQVPAPRTPAEAQQVLNAAVTEAIEGRPLAEVYSRYGADTAAERKQIRDSYLQAKQGLKDAAKKGKGLASSMEVRRGLPTRQPDNEPNPLSKLWRVMKSQPGLSDKERTRLERLDQLRTRQQDEIDELG